MAYIGNNPFVGFAPFTIDTFVGDDATITFSLSQPRPVNPRSILVVIDGVTQPAPAPRFSRTASALPSAPAHAGQHSRAVLADWGFDAGRITALIASGAVVDGSSKNANK
jgi:hypothetical protein